MCPDETRKLRRRRITGLALCLWVLVGLLGAAARLGAGEVVVVLADDFEGAFPGTAWTVSDANPASGRVFWGTTEYRAFVGETAGERSAWCAGNGRGDGDYYANDMESQMIAGPFDLSDAVAAELTFERWMKTEAGRDFFFYGVSIDGVEYFGRRQSGFYAFWQEQSLDLTDVPELGDVTGEPEVWVKFELTSDATDTEEGVFVDNVLLTRTIPVPDLALTEVTVAPETIRSGEEIVIGTVIENLGDTTSPGFTVTYYASLDATIDAAEDAVLTEIEQEGVEAGEEVTFEVSVPFPPSLPPGEYFVGALLTVADDPDLAIDDADPDNDGNFQAEPITVEPVPDVRAAFTMSPRHPDVGERIQLGDASSGVVSERRWDFGDGFTSRQRNPRHAYARAGSYAVTLTVTDPSGMVDALTRTVRAARPGASITVRGPQTGPAEVPLRLSARATGCRPADDGWLWETAGGEIVGEAGESVELRFRVPGIKSLAVANAACGSAVAEHEVTILPRVRLAPPAAPAGLRAEALPGARVALQWTGDAESTDAFYVEARPEGRLLRTVAVVPGDVTAAVVGGLGPERTVRFRLRAGNERGLSERTPAVSVTTSPLECTAGPASLCLLDERFRVTLTWRKADGRTGVGRAVALGPWTGFFSLDGTASPDVLVRVHKARGGIRVVYGISAGVELTIEVTDTRTGVRERYFHPPGGPGSGFELFDGVEEAAPPARQGELTFRPSPEPSTARAAVQFLDDLSSEETLRFWRFGDGELAVSRAPLLEHVYEEAGEPTVELLVLEPGDQIVQSRTLSRTIQLLAVSPAIKIHGATSGVAGQPSYFYASVVGCAPDPEGWRWSAGGGEIAARLDDGPLTKVLWSTTGPKTLTVYAPGCRLGSHRIDVVARRPETAPADAPCSFLPAVQCLQEGRFRVEASLPTAGGERRGRAVPLSEEAGLFWFFAPQSFDLVVRVLDRSQVNGHFWVSYVGLTGQPYTLTVTDTATGRVWQYRNPAGEIASAVDRKAFAAD